MTVNLRFAAAIGPQPGGTVRLTFGAVGDAVVPDPPGSNLTVFSADRWSGAQALSPLGISGAWTAGAKRAADTAASWTRMLSLLPAARLVPWQATVRMQPVTVWAPWQALLPRYAAAGMPWQHATTLYGWDSAAWAAAIHALRGYAAPWGVSLARAALYASQSNASKPLSRAGLEPWEAGLQLESWGGQIIAAPIPGPTPCYSPPAGDAVTLVFRDLLSGITDLLFSCGRRSFVRVPIQRVYMLTNTTSITRVSDGANVPCLSFTLSLDADSWTWGFSATLQDSALALLEPSSAGEPVELEASVNGTAFRLFAESMQRDRTFGSASVRVVGRGKAAVLDAPYSAIATFDNASSALTSQQLLDAAMPYGWAATWGLTAWSVPAGAWSHQGTPISAALAIAAAGGGYVQPLDTASGIAVLPRYPSAPWNWGSVTPDYELPSSVTTREGIAWEEKPRYNRVFVSGTGQGVLAQVTRAGTAGDVVAPMITDPLITHVDAGRQRGLIPLADTGRKALVTLRLPVLPATGVIRPGKFVRYVDGGTTRLGLVRSVSVDVTLPTVWQSITVETQVN